MIPKIIHYCWLSNDPYPDKIRKCLESWHRYLPDYKFILWNRDSFDIDSVTWTKQAFERKKICLCSRLYSNMGIKELRRYIFGFRRGGSKKVR